MDTVFYDAGGHPIAYTEDIQTIYLFTGEPVAYFDEESVYTFSGRHLGRFSDGWLRDNYGDCVFFTDEAHGNPTHPAKQNPPTKELKHVIPVRQPKERRALTPIKAATWSRLSGRQFFEFEYVP